VKIALVYPIEAYDQELIREADLVIDVEGFVIKNRFGSYGVEATDDQIADCTEVDAEQAEKLLADFRAGR
jgi:hypothetical protein